MVLTLEQQQGLNGDRALEIINQYRDIVGELTIESLEVEFPSEMHLLRPLGVKTIKLVGAGENAARAFKVRGALNGAHRLREAGASTIAVPSAGNHARGAIEAARVLGLYANVVVPTTASAAKSKGLYELGSPEWLRVYQEGESFNESLEWLSRHTELGSLLHPFDDPYVIAGQGTLVDDIFAQIDSVDHIVVPIGGGGLAAGIAHRLEEKDNKHTKLHIVEAPGSDSMSRSLAKGTPVAATKPNKLYGGSAVLLAGALTLHLLAMFNDQNRLSIHSPSQDEIDGVIGDYMFDRKLYGRENTPNYEPTSLVAIANLREIVQQHPGESIVVVGTGHNAPLH